ncbi:hypothetical protein LAU_0082 [Lausannevirus]|uniref:Uncharacterized protein n=2 Tax=Lausannevirus TaxID=999883 RepID=A0A0N9PLV1_9VIRU|nr:hypothetical protein LAU_0082 [Lausannevirus]AEA06936.1 hypothetical protein LAU_0082 [Lausannevirus]ALH06774.1 hypothetical protein PMV_076 [Port-miou virus]
MSRYVPRLLKFLEAEFELDSGETIVDIEPRTDNVLVKLCVPKYCVSSSWFEVSKPEFDQYQQIETSLECRIYESLYYRRETRRKVTKMRKELEQMKNALEAAFEKILELEYAPDGPKAREAKKDFERLCQQ